MKQLYTDMNRRLFLGLCLLVCVISHSGAAEDPFTPLQLTLDGSITGADLQLPLENVPVLVRLHPGNFSGFEALGTNGSHLKLFDDQGTLLPLEVESFDPELHHLWIWTLIPKIDSQFKGGHFSLKLDQGETSGSSNQGTVFRDPYKVVLHFSDSTILTNAAGPPLQGNAGDCHQDSSGWIGSGLHLGPSCHLVVQGGIPETTTWTLSFWSRLASLGPSTLLSLSSSDDRVHIGQRGGIYRIRISHKGEATEMVAPMPVQPDAWHHLGLVVSADGVRFYLDGEKVSQGRQHLDLRQPVMVVGERNPDDLGEATLDELVLSTVPFSDDRIRFDYRSQSPDFAVLGFDEPGGGAPEEGESNLEVVLKNVTADSWAIIALIAALFGVAAHVAVAKILQVGRWKLQLEGFLDIYDELADSAKDDPYLLEAAFRGENPAALDLWRGSPLYPIFEIIQKGLFDHHRRYGLMPLSSLEVEGLRVRIANERFHLGQILNKRLVILTIAISGGPFIGLLGTVLGVMITFASIARTGDVDINAIAPGMSGALLATVAGLMVAIPALFAYNLLLSEIKSVSLRLKVFADAHLAYLLESLELRLRGERSDAG
jgi:biopolymer transport protein ExbB